MIKLQWGLKQKPPQVPPLQNIVRHSGTLNTIRLEDDNALTAKPTSDVLLLCDALKSNTVNQYFSVLETKPKKKLVKIFMQVIYANSSMLPPVFDDEMPPVTIAGAALEPVQNTQARIMTKIALLLVVRNESEKTGVWDCMHQAWTEVYIAETKTYVRILESIAAQCENTKQHHIVPDLRRSIEGIKYANLRYGINW
jgi:hypothetical protein